MMQPISQLISDFLSALLFLAVYLATGDITAAALVAIGRLGPVRGVQTPWQADRADAMDEPRSGPRPERRDDPDPKPALRDAEAEHRPFRDCRDDATSRLDAALPAGDRTAETAGKRADRGRLCL